MKVVNTVFVLAKSAIFRCQPIEGENRDPSEGEWERSRGSEAHAALARTERRRSARLHFEFRSLVSQAACTPEVVESNTSYLQSQFRKSPQQPTRKRMEPTKDPSKREKFFFIDLPS